jgi:hypothetical protein
VGKKHKIKYKNQNKSKLKLTKQAEAGPQSRRAAADRGLIFCFKVAWLRRCLASM